MLAKHTRKSRSSAIRWTLEKAAREFGINPRTVSTRVASAGIVPDPDGYFSTAKIHAAIFGDIEAERLRKTKEEADKLALENEKTRGSLVEVEAVYQHFAGIYIGFRARILASQLTRQEQDEILTDLQRLKARNLSTPEPRRKVETIETDDEPKSPNEH